MENYLVCIVPSSPLRKSSSDRAEMVSQILFGERAELLEKQEKWLLVKTKHDQYEGWVDPKQFTNIDSKNYANDDNFKFITPVQFENRLTDDDGTDYYLTIGSTLPNYQNDYCTIGDKKFHLNFKPVIPSNEQWKDSIENFAKFYLNTSYLWGGRSLFGIDCSGFTQMVYKQLNVTLPRDASQQIELGQGVDFLASSQLGDLAFFDNEEGEIIHVGLMLSNHQIIHASGKIRIVSIDNQGIYNADLKKHTHKLRIIKRLLF